MKFCEALKKAIFRCQAKIERNYMEGTENRNQLEGVGWGRRGQSLNAVKHIHLSNFILLIRLLSGVDGCRPYFCISVYYIFWGEKPKRPKGSIRHQHQNPQQCQWS